MIVSSEVSGKVLKVNYDVGDSIGKKNLKEKGLLNDTNYM